MQNFPQVGGAKSESGCANLFFAENCMKTNGIPGGYRLVSTYDLPVFQWGGGG